MGKPEGPSRGGGREGRKGATRRVGRTRQRQGANSAPLKGFSWPEHQRSLRGLPRNSRSLHTLFLGNPGTGKTTVARILGKSYREMGILSTGHFVEVDRSQIVGTHVGETEANMTVIVKQAPRGGVIHRRGVQPRDRGGKTTSGSERSTNWFGT